MEKEPLSQLCKMKTAVIIPSHIHYQDQLLRLDACLESLYSQTIVPDIFVSISFANTTYKRDFSTLLRKYSNIKFKFSSQQKFQMEHLKVLSSFVSGYDMIMFCDDDDTYDRERVEIFMNVFKEYCAGNKFGGIRETKDNEDFPEYWGYGIKPHLLTQFFIRIKGYEDLMRHKFADMYLRNYLRTTGGKDMIFVILTNKPGCNLYQYTIDNPNSICGKIDKQKQITYETAKNNLTVSLITDRMDLVSKQMSILATLFLLQERHTKGSYWSSGTPIPIPPVNIIVPDADRIKRLTKILYR